MILHSFTHIRKMTSSENNPDFWEEQYHDIYKNLQLYQENFERDLNFFEQRCRLSDEKLRERNDMCKSLESCVKKLGDEIKSLQKGEESYIKERTGLISGISQLEKTLSENIGQNKKTEEKNKRVKESFRDSLQRSRDALSDKTDLVLKLEESVARLSADNQELRDTLSDIKNQVECKDVKVHNKYDKLFAMYVSLFSHDEDSLRHRFQDKTTQGSNYAFRMLLKMCHSDVTKEVNHIQYLVPKVDSMVDAILFHKIEITACMYARTIQLRYSNLFDDASDALAKAKDLTKYKIKFEQVDLNNARATFVVALLEAMQSVDAHKSGNMTNGESVCGKVISTDDDEHREDMCPMVKKQKLDNSINKAFGFD